MVFFSKWLLYRIPQSLSRNTPSCPDVCFRCQAEGVANWTHVIRTCQPIQDYRDKVLKLLTATLQISITPSIGFLVLGYDPVARLPPRTKKLVFIATAIARSLSLQNWRSVQIPTFAEWLNKMVLVRNQELSYAKRVAGLKRFSQTWDEFFRDDR
ncbi:hypothetical protein NDU88_002515 [Pleurodeles waltl]|uniref:Reverse transcriptase n=1 Tax=Pleurodeles waltl TaxID=8319 RepID=A0AAV7LED8_PLEWA|nr:hypothetical protein NDU88_002515 [Pleurodeles waltl]